MSKKKQKYKFIKTDKELSSTDVERFKDFKNLKANYDIMTKPLSKTSIYRFKNKKVFLGLVLIVIIAYLLFFSK